MTMSTHTPSLRRTVLFDDDTYLKGRGLNATMEARLWLETSEEFKQVRSSGMVSKGFLSVHSGPKQKYRSGSEY